MPQIKNLYNDSTSSDLIIDLQDGSKLFAHRLILNQTAPSLRLYLANDSICVGEIPQRLDLKLFHSTSVRIVIAALYGNKLHKVWNMVGLNVEWVEKKESYRFSCNSKILLDVYQFIIFLDSMWLIAKLEKQYIQPTHDNLVHLLLFGCNQPKVPKFMCHLFKIPLNDDVLVSFAAIKLTEMMKILTCLCENESAANNILHLIVLYNLTHDKPIDIQSFNISDYTTTKENHKALVAVIVVRSYLQSNPLANIYHNRAIEILKNIQCLKGYAHHYYQIENLMHTMQRAKIIGPGYRIVDFCFTSEFYTVKDCKDICLKEY